MPDPTNKHIDAEELTRTPALEGLRMPAEWTDHARTWISWPHRKELWQSNLGAAEDSYESLIKIISHFEPVSVVFHPDDYLSVTSRLGKQENVTLDGTNIDDSWIRDNGPTFLTGDGKELSATIWNFNAWGHKFSSYEADARLAETICRKKGIHS